MKKISRRELTVNVCGAVGYMLLMTVWAFFAAVLLALVFDATGTGQAPEVIQSSSGQSAPSSPGPVIVVATFIITGVIALLTLAIIVTLPYFVGKWGSRIVKALLRLCKIDMTRQQLFFMKSVLVALPLLGLMIIQLILQPESITFAAMYGVTVVLAIAAIILFFVQTILARRFGIGISKVW